MKKVLTVTQINRYIKNVLEEDIILQSVFVSGEISNFKGSSGHWYFTLKDDQGAISCVMFKNQAAEVPFQPENGMKVILYGRVSLYEKTGNYQIYGLMMEPEGIGAMHLAFEQLKEKLAQKGYFDQTHKKPIPSTPKTIALITSPTGAVVKDMIAITKRRHQGINLVVIPILVQGRDAPKSIVEGLTLLDEWGGADVAILARGGGSAEDLWAFNDEGVATAIYHCQTPLISAVGHETDVTIADFVADLRAPTPSAAAELAVPFGKRQLAELAGLTDKLTQLITHKLETQQRQVSQLIGRRVFTYPAEPLIQAQSHIQGLVKMMALTINQKIVTEKGKQGQLISALNNLSPLQVLARGYGVISHEGQVVKNTQGLEIGQEIAIKMQDGDINAQVTTIKRNSDA